MKFLTRLCQDDVTTSNSDDISRKKFHIDVREKISGDVTKGILQTCHGLLVLCNIYHGWYNVFLPAVTFVTWSVLLVIIFRSVPEGLISILT